MINELIQFSHKQRFDLFTKRPDSLRFNLHKLKHAAVGVVQLFVKQLLKLAMSTCSLHNSCQYSDIFGLERVRHQSLC